MPPAIPVATYRVQLTADFGFAQAAEIVPYLKALGVSHFYASPFLKARRGSTHGYDVIDHNALNPELGGEQGLATLSAALAAADMGLILDFVPNHMGVHFADNDWWLDVLEWGPQSPAAIAFDIDWDTLPFRPHGGVLLPILGRSYGEALTAGDLVLKYDAAEGSFSVWFFDHRLPVHPGRYCDILDAVVAAAGAADDPAGREIAALAGTYRNRRGAWREEARRFKAALAALDGAPAIIERGLGAYRAGPDAPEATAALHQLLESQNYRPAHWRTAATEINYRRFFDVDTLAGLRVEERKTFDAIHKLVARLIGEGRLHGIRLDHIDGLRDPHQYFRRLQRLLRTVQPAGAPPAYVVIEKILGEGEACPDFAGVSGTTGYEWLNVISRVLIDDNGLAALDATWRRVSGVTQPFAQTLEESKRTVIRSLLASEFTVLTRLLARIAAGHYTTRDFTADRLREALELFVIHMPVYRSYVTAHGVSENDRAIIAGAIAKARADWLTADTAIFDFLQATLTCDLVAPGRSGHSPPRVRRFAFKTQQFTGPAMAKSLEDTAFYRHHALLAQNEVGGDPREPSLTPDAFHAMMGSRASAHRNGMTATATHDTKRGEDARMRILALAEMPERWTEAVAKWRGLNAGLVDTTGETPAPSPAHEYMLYQAMLGAWPQQTSQEAAQDAPDDAFRDRITVYATKAMREGKLNSSWLNPNARYEEAVKRFVAAILDPAMSPGFLASFSAFAARTSLIGALNSLSQTALKALMPGVPDVYQGCEFWDLSLVDPDNRRPVDFAARTALIADDAPADWTALAAHWDDGHIKFALTRRLLAARNAHAGLFAHGDYTPLRVEGVDRDHVVAFAIEEKDRAVIAVIGRHFAPLTQDGERWPETFAWDATLDLRAYSDVTDALSDRTIPMSAQTPASSLLGAMPVVVLTAQR